MISGGIFNSLWSHVSQYLTNLKEQTDEDQALLGNNDFIRKAIQGLIDVVRELGRNIDWHEASRIVLKKLEQL